jgi:hypothetical protein
MCIHIVLTILYIRLFFAIFEGKVYSTVDDKEKVKSQIVRFRIVANLPWLVTTDLELQCFIC